jgi:hypothetical protein
MFSTHLNWNYKRKYEKLLCETWGSHGGEDVDVGLLGCNAVTIFRAEDVDKTLCRNVGSHGIASQQTNIDEELPFQPVHVVMNALSYTSTPPIRLYDVVLTHGHVLVFVSENNTGLSCCLSVYLSTI